MPRKAKDPDLDKKANEYVRKVEADYRAFFENYDIILSPVLFKPPLLIGEQGSHKSFEDVFASVNEYMWPILRNITPLAIPQLACRFIPAPLACPSARNLQLPTVKRPLCCIWLMNWKKLCHGRIVGPKFRPISWLNRLKTYPQHAYCGTFSSMA